MNSALKHIANTDNRSVIAVSHVAPDWADDLCVSLYLLACSRPAVARLIGDWIRAALERKGGA